MSHSKPRILFIGEALTDCHLIRPWCLARSLSPSRYEIFFAADRTYAAPLGIWSPSALPIGSQSREIARRNILLGRPIFDEATLSHYVEQDRDLLRSLRPDAVVGDMRLSLGIAARLERVLYLNVTNLHWSPWAEISFPRPQLEGPLGLAPFLFPVLRPLAFSLHARPMNRARSKFGLPPLGPDVRHVYCDGDAVLFADPLGWVPQAQFPSHFHCIGPICWSRPAPLPMEWAQGRGKKIYIALGSSGHGAAFAPLWRALAEIPADVLVSTSGRALSLGPRITTVPFAPTEQAAAQADLVISHGGTATSYPVLRRGKPLFAFPSNLDQFLSMVPIRRAGAGDWARPERFHPKWLRSALERMLEESGPTQRAQELGHWVRRTSVQSEFPRCLERILGDPASAPSASRAETR